MQSVNPDPELATLRARVAELEGLLDERERAAKAHRAQTEKLMAELSAKTASFEATLLRISDGVIVCDLEGKFLHFNEAAEVLMGLGAVDAPPGDWSRTYGIFMSDGVTPCPAEDLPLMRAARGESVDGAELFIRNPKRPAGTWIEASSRTLTDERGARIGAVVVLRDITERKRYQTEMAQKLTAEREKNEALERLRVTVQELSTPILEVWDDILALPLVGVVDSKRAQEVMQSLLEAVVSRRGRYVIFDVTGVDVVDSATADHLLRIVGAVELLGARCVLTGIRPPVAQTLVDLGVQFGSLVTTRNLKHGLRTCLAWKAGAESQDGEPRSRGARPGNGPSPRARSQ